MTMVIIGTAFTFLSGAMSIANPSMGGTLALLLGALVNIGAVCYD